jgi:hypothetical protein
MESSQVTMGGRFRFSHHQQAKGEDTVAKRKTMSTSKQREMSATEYSVRSTAAQVMGAI